jgi:hypothetical protein
LQVSPEITQPAFTRYYISALLGGDAFSTMPSISKKFKHGYNLICMNYNFNPSAPRQPGQNGLFMTGFPFRPGGSYDKTYHIFIKQATNCWQFFGVYKMQHVAEITLEEWLFESDIVSASSHATLSSAAVNC